ncbi:hypothetical protein [Salinibaculum rarum]|uniref:hypothetical protein n=1 Tax=Salinibaculum rarum TaxID=3058903 RepID=UPI00265E9994|nr:hypothetical protein [Salinibaculum sp. KK48]
MSHQFETARFHIRTGPDSLFQRVRSVLDEPTELRIDPDHVQKRAEERSAPLDKLKHFDPEEWELKTAEVRKDKCLFVNTAWSCTVDGRNWWVVIGYDDTVVTVIESDKDGLGEQIVTSGELYDEVEMINRLKNNSKD